MNEILNMKLYQTCVREEEDRDTLCKHRKVVLFCDWGGRRMGPSIKTVPPGDAQINTGPDKTLYK